MQNNPSYKNQILQFLLVISFFLTQYGFAQEPKEDVPGSLHQEQGILKLQTSQFELHLLKSSQTIGKLAPQSAPEFDYTPGSVLNHRDQDGYYHLGDLNLRLKIAASENWKNYSSATKRADVEALIPEGNVLAAANLQATFPEDIPVKVTRYWEKSGNDILLRFHLENITSKPVIIGALGVPMIFNNILSGKSLDEAHAQNVFFDPYIGKDAGYLQAVKLDGKGPVLLVLPEKNAAFEAYNPLNDDPTRRGITFEGFHEWMVHSQAYAEQEWRESSPWNVPTSSILNPNASQDYAFRFTLAPSVREIEATLQQKKRPVAIGIPGYVLPKDVQAKLFIQYSKKIQSIQVQPEGALSVEFTKATPSLWQEYAVKGLKWGRARLTISYEDGLRQTIQYKVIKSETDVVADFGNFLMTKQWYENPNDPFGRDQSVISYDYEDQLQVEHDSRAWIAGLGDEGGAGSWLGAMMKEEIQPKHSEVNQLEKFMTQTLWGKLQYSEDLYRYGVKKSLYYYEPEKMPEGTYSKKVDYTTWAAWSKAEADSPGRSYNYPHVTAAHWVMYRLARYHENLVPDEWKKHIENAYHTAMAMTELAAHYAQYGQMEGTIFYLLLKDLKREGFTGMATTLETAMKSRADVWKSLNYPFGSEMPWDSTGQEEVYVWSRYFGYDEKAEVTLNAILAYMPTVPHWGYNGSARRYWDFLYGGKIRRVERQLHHYGSALNSIPILMEYRKHPDDLYLLRVGYGGVLGAISNITKDGFGSAAFHSYPSTLDIDPLSGDYGSGFFGYAINSASYLCKHDELGWLGFGGNVLENEHEIILEITTAAKSKVYVAPAGLWITLDAGQVKKVTYNRNEGTVTLTLEGANADTKMAYFQLEQTQNTENGIKFLPKKKLKTINDAYTIKLGKKSTTLTLEGK